MPILLPPDPEAPLRQGDVLAKVSCYLTDEDGSALTSEPGYVLVTSRPCNTIRDEQIIVAQVVPRSLSSDGVQGLEGVDETRRYLSGLRDGGILPDHFYLGELEPNSGKRYFAKFDSLHTIKIPSGLAERRAFLLKHRRFHLSLEFVRDLHIRIFLSFARLGFDDYDWYSNADLQMVIRQGEAALAKAQSDLANAERDLALADAANKDKEMASLQKQIKNREVEVEKAKRELQPFLEEQVRRRAKISP